MTNLGFDSETSLGDQKLSSTELLLCSKPGDQRSNYFAFTSVVLRMQKASEMFKIWAISLFSLHRPLHCSPFPEKYVVVPPLNTQVIDTTMFILSFDAIRLHFPTFSSFGRVLIHVFTSIGFKKYNQQRPTRKIVNGVTQ
jgi:hypothetical protein